jgi:Lrp/AsnC family transcriptional regulator, leucine-responsive regulatory protein
MIAAFVVFFIVATDGTGRIRPASPRRPAAGQPAHRRAARRPRGAVPQRLRETGVIEREIAIVAPAAVGRRMSMVVQVTLEREHPATSAEFQRQMRRAPEVTQCYNVTGAIDFVLIVSVADMEAYEDFTRQYLFEKHVRRFETMVVIDRVKFETTVPIADGGRD